MNDGLLAVPDGCAADLRLGAVLERLADALELKGVAEAAQAVAEVLGLVFGPSVLILAGRSWPGGDAYVPPAELWSRLGLGGTVRIPPAAAPATLAGRACEVALAAPAILFAWPSGCLPGAPPLVRLAALALAQRASESGPGGLTPPTTAGATLEPLVEVGRAAVRLAHDINNPLCTVSLSLQLLGGDIAAANHPAARRRLLALEESVARIRELVTRFVRDKCAAGIVTSESPAPVERTPSDRT